jgi:hypothetical protein
MRIELGRNQTAVVGYGSLVSRVSAERTLGRPYDGPFERCHVAGWRRSWDIAMPNEAFYYRDGGQTVYPRRILYLNVRPDPDTLLNAVVFLVNPRELEAMHAREWIYDARVVTHDLRGVTVEGGDAIMYVAKPDYIVRGVRDPREAAVRASYLRIVQDGLDETDEAFRAEFARTSDPVPAHLVVEDIRAGAVSS